MQIKAQRVNNLVVKNCKWQFYIWKSRSDWVIGKQSLWECVAKEKGGILILLPRF